MTSPPTGVDAVEHDGVLVLSVEGDLDGAAAGPLMDRFETASRHTTVGAVLLDLARCAYINSTGIAIVVALLARCQSRGLQLSARGLSEHYRHVFDITRLSEHLRVLPPESPTEES